MGVSRNTLAGLVVAIDGPAGAGKSTVSRAVAAALGLGHLDTGSMYRALTWKALAAGVAPSDEDGLVALSHATEIDVTPEGITVDGTLAGGAIRTAAVDRVVSEVSAHPRVRRQMVRMQREILASGGVVAEGRDIGTVVYPEAPLKVFLTASIAERARRRHADLVAAGETVTRPDVEAEIVRRDQLDSTRDASPLSVALDAVVVDTTDKTVAQVVDDILALARERAAEGERT